MLIYINDFINLINYRSMHKQVEELEQKIREIFRKERLLKEDVKKANRYLEDWKTLTRYKEDTRNPIKS